MSVDNYELIKEAVSKKTDEELLKRQKFLAGLGALVGGGYGIYKGKSVPKIFARGVGGGILGSVYSGTTEKAYKRRKRLGDIPLDKY